MHKTDTCDGYVALGDDERGEGKSSERYLDTCRVTTGTGRTNQAPQRSINHNKSIRQRSRKEHNCGSQWFPKMSQTRPATSHPFRPYHLFLVHLPPPYNIFLVHHCENLKRHLPQQKAILQRPYRQEHRSHNSHKVPPQINLVPSLTCSKL